MQLSETLMLAGINEVERRGWGRLTLERTDGRLAARLSPYGKQAATTEDTATLNEWSA